MWKGLGALLAQNPKKRYVLQGVSHALTVEDAEKACIDVFAKFPNMAKVESVANGLLMIKVTNPIHLQELNLRKNLFLRALQDREIAVRDIRIQLRFPKSDEEAFRTDEEYS